MIFRIDRFEEAKARVRAAAIARWQERGVVRAQTKAIIAASGPGTADSVERQTQFARRVARLRSLGTSEVRRAFSMGVERRLGPRLNWVGLPPSEQARRAGRPVARILDSVAPGIDARGFATGFLISTDLLMTNWHVFSEADDARGCGANFLYEQTQRGVSRGITFELEPARFFASDERLDFAIVAVSPSSGAGEHLADLGQVTPIEATPKILKGDPVNIIQYPKGGPKMYALDENRLVDILEQEGFLHYETDTLEGSSGSPAFSSMWELVALHHASIPEIRDGVVIDIHGRPWTEEMGDEAVHWVANEGIRVSAIVARLRSMSPSSPSQAAILNELLASTADPVPEAVAVARRLESHPGAGSAISGLSNWSMGDEGMAGIQFTFTGPVTINVSGTAAPQHPGPAPSPHFTTTKAVERSIRFDPDYASREGYAPNFLDPEGEIIVPAPKVAPERIDELYREDGVPRVLKYHHFELMMNRARRMQMWSAVNVDYAPSRKTDRERDAWGSDRWIPDPRIPAEVQIFDADFYKPAGNIDRGHIVRREDNEWGDDETEIEFANSDTFHWTNCTPQHEAFNQSDPVRNDRTYRGMEGIWGALENHVQNSRRGDDTKACIIAGPILAKNDPSADFGRGEIQYPLRFYKIVCVADELDDAKELRVFGFILDQKDVVERFGIERFGPGRFRRFQVALKEIEAAAGIILDPALHNADTFTG